MSEQEKNSGNAVGGYRSPRYPSISLPKAIKRVAEVYAKAQHHFVGLNVLADSWDYSPKSSGVAQTVATLQQFGLLAAEGGGKQRRYKLTDAALRIVQDADPASGKRKQAIERAALKPKIHKELWDSYGPDVGDAVLQNYLTLDRREAGVLPFNEKAAAIVIRVYRESINFAEISKDAAPVPDAEYTKNSDETTGEGGTEEENNPGGNSTDVQIQKGERVVFTEEESAENRLRVMLRGELNEYLLEALEDYVKRQRKRLGINASSKKSE